MAFETYGIFQPMKYMSKAKPEILAAALEDDNYCIQLKQDGISYVLAHNLDGSVGLYGDKVSKKTGEVINKIDNLPHFITWAEENMPRGSQILVELLYYYDWSSGKPELKDHVKNPYLNSIMLALPPKAIARQAQTQEVSGYIFDILFWDGEPIHKQDFADRWEFISRPEVLGKWVDRTDMCLATTIYTGKALAIQEWLAGGYEGGVLKALHSYGKVKAYHHLREIGATAARPAHVTYKIKENDTVDLIIMDRKPAIVEYAGKEIESWTYWEKWEDEDWHTLPIEKHYGRYKFNAETLRPVTKGHYYGWYTSLVLGAYDEAGEMIRVCDVSSGLTDANCQDILDNWEDYLGGVSSLTCMSLDKKEKTVRHPRISILLRADKEAKDCLMSEIFGG